MSKLVYPKVYLVGYTGMDYKALVQYLEDTHQEDFKDDVTKAKEEGISDGEIMCSAFAKLCYKSLTVGKNSNVTKTRSVKDNLKGCYDTGHGSIFEHFQLNFIVTDCSRVFTHEQVRHRPGFAYSQTSGRYCRVDSLDLVWDPILDPAKDIVLDGLSKIEDTIYLMECKLGLRKPPTVPEDLRDSHLSDQVKKDPLTYKTWKHLTEREKWKWVPNNSFDFELRKKITSAIRRLAPNGQTNEIAISCNIRALRQTIMIRTARAAEFEIRYIYNQIYHIIKERFPLMFYQAKTRMVDGMLEVYGMKTQPFEQQNETDNS